MATGEDREAITLEKVLFTVLDANPIDLRALEEVRQSAASGAKSGLFGWIGYYGTGGNARATAQPLKVIRNKPDISMDFD